jgi:calcineurin-like phosphoesterase family protein
MSRVLFTADWHLGHKNIHKYRQEFETAEEHDLAVFSLFMSILTKRDVLYIMGDVCFCRSKMWMMEKIAAKISQLCIILGNHDLEKGSSPTLHDWLSIQNCKVYGMKSYKGFWLSHAPIHAEELRGKRNIHGHTHYNSIDDDRYINASLEVNNYKPVILTELVKETTCQKTAHIHSA